MINFILNNKNNQAINKKQVIQQCTCIYVYREQTHMHIYAFIHWKTKGIS